ncbi:MAG: YdcH family protein [Candidatus Dadabacteria bacterium]|nr:YdcH family protein [Candidatus Dadabacteria bacterium]
MNDTEIIQKLIEGDEEFKTMYYEHRELDGKVKDLETRASGSPDREVEIKRLKKMKLALKDQMEEKKRKFIQSK